MTTRHPSIEQMQLRRPPQTVQIVALLVYVSKDVVIQRPFPHPPYREGVVTLLIFFIHRQLSYSFVFSYFRFHPLPHREGEGRVYRVFKASTANR